MAYQGHTKYGFIGKISKTIAGTCVATLIGASNPAVAQVACAPRDDVIAKLGKQHAEAPTAIGLSSDGQVIEVLVSATGSTFTIIVTTVEGVSCVAAEGEAWIKLPKKVAGRAS